MSLVNEPAVYITPEAINYINNLLVKDNHAVGVRLAVKKAGCSGFEYKFDSIAVINADDLVRPFSNKYSLYVDKNSYDFIKGTIVDLIKNEMGQKLIFKNPNVKGQCGCGESFTI